MVPPRRHHPMSQYPMSPHFKRFDIPAYGLKLAVNAIDWAGRKLIFNREPPPVADFVPDCAYGPDPGQRLDIIVPPGTAPFPVLVFFHGGGWVVGDKASYTRICKSLAMQGYLVVNVNYRLAPRYRCPDQIRDVAAALGWVTGNVQRYGGDASRIVLAGDSAGALLASWYAQALHDPQLRARLPLREMIPVSALMAVVLFYGVFDLKTVLRTGFPFMRTYVRSFLGMGAAEMAEWASPARHVPATLPPVFICAGQRDSLYSQSLDYAARLRDAGMNPTTLLFSEAAYPEARHGFLYLHNLPCTRKALDAVGEFLRRILTRHGGDPATDRGSTGESPR
jgi:acetyl esterase